MQWGVMGAGHRASLVGHCKDFGFHSSDESLENFKQKKDVIFACTKNDGFGACVENGPQRTRRSTELRQEASDGLQVLPVALYPLLRIPVGV